MSIHNMQAATQGALGALKGKMSAMKQENDCLKDENEALRREVENGKQEIARVSVPFLIPKHYFFLQAALKLLSSSGFVAVLFEVNI